MANKVIDTILSFDIVECYLARRPERGPFASITAIWRRLLLNRREPEKLCTLNKGGVSMFALIPEMT